jgi:nucleotide-binding universal stress UspA family protein
MPIVCGTDFSERSRSAMAVAAALVPRLKVTELWLVHVLDPTTGSLDSAAQEALKMAAQERLAKERVRLATHVGEASVRVQQAVLVGPVSDTLLGFAEQKKARLVVVSSQGHSASFVYRVGGTSERLAQSTQLPVLVVRDDGPFEAWAKGERPLRLLLAVDWSRSSDAAIRWVKALRELSFVDVVAGYVYNSGFPGEGPARYGLPWRHPIVERDPEAEALLIRDLKTRIGELGGKGELVVRPHLGVGRLGDHLLELAEAERVDLIVMGTHHRRGLARLGSVAAVTLHHSRTSVAIVPVPESELLAPDEVPCIRRVLIATDLSPLSNFAIPFGYALLGERGGEVYLLHVRGKSRETAASEMDVVAQLRTLVPKRGVPPNVVTRTEVVEHADTSLAICQAAERLGVDAVCVTSHGRGGVKRAVLGSVAEAVMRQSRRPVFVVRPLPH